MSDLNDVMHALGRLEAKVDTLMPLHARVGALEKAWAKVTGIALVLSLLASLLVQKFTGKN